jgi:hypothetical protein
MIVDKDGRLSPSASRIFKVANQFTLFRINADDRMTPMLEACSKFRRVAFRICLTSVAMVGSSLGCAMTSFGGTDGDCQAQVFVKGILPDKHLNSEARQIEPVGCVRDFSGELYDGEWDLTPSSPGYYLQNGRTAPIPARFRTVCAGESRGCEHRHARVGVLSPPFGWSNRYKFP